LIVTRAPLRVSFIGGGTDYQSFIVNYGGAVIATSIDKYVYVNLLELPVFAREKFRFTYRKTESVSSVDAFEHPSVRATLQSLKWTKPLNIATMANVPGSSGLGSSSAFVVALRHSLGILSGEDLTPNDLAKFAINVERNLLQEPGGMQDQFEAAFGGLRFYRFSENKTDVGEPKYERDSLGDFSMYFTLVSLTSPREDNSHAINTSKADRGFLIEMLRETEKFGLELQISKSIVETASILTRAISTDWELKKEFSPGIASAEALAIIKRAKDHGALAAKVCGAGGSGFVLLAHEKDAAASIRNLYPEGFAIPVNFTGSGSEVISR
jgi:D-glycero-alpha-D-manno-heptose-7-phosphate kinase